MTRGFTSNSVVYKSPSLKNIKLVAGYSGKYSSGDTHAGIEYSASGSVVGLQYLDLGENAYVANAADNDSAIRLYGRHQKDSWKFSGSIETLDKKSNSAVTESNESYLNLSLEKKIEKIGRIALSYGMVKDAKSKLFNGVVHEGSGRGFSAGAFYNWLPTGEIYLVGSRLNFSENLDQNSIVLGVNYHFDI